MKLFGLIFILSIGLSSYGQSIYGSISGGMQNIINVQGSSAPMVNTIYNMTQVNYSTTQPKKSFRHLYSADVSFGHMIHKNIGYELSISYLRPTTYYNELIVYNNQTGEPWEGNTFVEDRHSGHLFRLNPKVVLNTDFNKISMYMKMGFLAMMGKLQYHQYTTSDASSFNDAQTSMIYEYEGKVSLGFNGCIGASKKLSNNMALFIELTAAHQNFSPTFGQRTHHIQGGTDQMAYGTTPYYHEIIYGDVYETSLNSPESNDNPQKFYSRNYSLSGYGITLGITYTFWEKKEEDIKK